MFPHSCPLGQTRVFMGDRYGSGLWLARKQSLSADQRIYREAAVFGLTFDLIGQGGFGFSFMWGCHLH